MLLDDDVLDPWDLFGRSLARDLEEHIDFDDDTDIIEMKILKIISSLERQLRELKECIKYREMWDCDFCDHSCEICILNYSNASGCREFFFDIRDIPISKWKKKRKKKIIRIRTKAKEKIKILKKASKKIERFRKEGWSMTDRKKRRKKK